MNTKIALSLALAILVATLAVVPTITTVTADTKTINADKVVIKKGEDITINVNGQVGPKGDKGDPGADSTVPGPAGRDGVNGSDSTGPGPEGPPGRDGTTLSDETVAAVNQVVNQSAVLNQLYEAFLNGSLSSVSIETTNNTG